jgi:hypothetical protein
VRDIVLAYEKHHAHELMRKEKNKENLKTDKSEEK